MQILNAPAAAAEADGAKEGKKENIIEEPAGLECLRRMLFREGLVLEEARLQEEAPEGISLFSAANPDQEMQLAGRHSLEIVEVRRSVEKCAECRPDISKEAWARIALIHANFLKSNSHRVVAIPEERW